MLYEAVQHYISIDTVRRFLGVSRATRDNSDQYFSIVYILKITVFGIRLQSMQVTKIQKL